jgi:hypothetical protein
LKEYDISNLIDYEQDIITGVNKNGDKISNKDIFTKFTTLNINKKDIDIKTRIVATIMLNLDLSESELNRLIENNQNIKKIIDNLTWFGIYLNNFILKILKIEKFSLFILKIINKYYFCILSFLFIFLSI